MSELAATVAPHILADIDTQAQEWLAHVFKRFGGRYPALEEIWQLMDEAWVEHGCDAKVVDARIDNFYRDPVWLLNGLFLEQHEQSLENRRQFCEWVVQQRPKRVADYGGGFGGLARMIAIASPDAQVEVIEPHPNAAAMALARAYRNVSYQPQLTGYYDVLLATDVFEHVPDPLALVVGASEHLRPSGKFLIANCFYPVMQCHLPSTFHFRFSWHTSMQAMGLEAGASVCYGRVYIRKGHLDLKKARMVEKRSRLWFRLLERTPSRIRRRLVRGLFPID